jgi:hypothetical protein
MALGGIEHGIGEVLQGNTAPAGIMFPSWPDSAFFHSLSGEPAMTIIPNLLITGILTIVVSLALFVWAILFAQRKHGGLIMIPLSLAMLLVGGGIFPPILTMIVAAVGTMINALLSRRRARPSGGFRRFLGKLWPWSLIACIVSWLALMLGPGLFDYFFGVDSLDLILALMSCAAGTLLLAIIAGFAHDTVSGPQTRAV